MKFTFIYEDEEENYKVSYECREIVWWETLPHYENFLRGVGYIIPHGVVQAEGYSTDE